MKQEIKALISAVIIITGVVIDNQAVLLMGIFILLMNISTTLLSRVNTKRTKQESKD